MFKLNNIQLDIIKDNFNFDFKKLNIAETVNSDEIERITREIWATLRKITNDTKLEKELDQVIKEEYAKYQNWYNNVATEIEIDNISMFDDHWEINIYPVQIKGQCEDITSISISNFYNEKEFNNLSEHIEYIVNNIKKIEDESSKYQDWHASLICGSIFCYYDYNNKDTRYEYQTSKEEDYMEDNIKEYILSKITFNKRENSIKIINRPFKYDQDLLLHQDKMGENYKWKYPSKNLEDNFVVVHKIKLRKEDYNEGYVMNIIDDEGNIFEYKKDPEKQEPYVRDEEFDMYLYSEKSKISNINCNILEVIKNINDIAFIVPYLINSDNIFNYDFNISPHKFVIDKLIKLNIYDKSIDKYNNLHDENQFEYSDDDYTFDGWYSNDKKKIFNFTGTIDGIVYKYHLCKLYAEYYDNINDITIHTNYFKRMLTDKLTIKKNNVKVNIHNRDDGDVTINYFIDNIWNDLYITKNALVYTNWDDWNNNTNDNSSY